MFRGDRLKALRERYQYTHQELADLLQIGFATVYRLEAGRSDPTGELLSRISQLFSVSVDYLLGMSDEQTSHITDLTDDEKALVAYYRQGELLDAIKIIMGKA